MIVTCPNCTTRFKVDPDALYEEGRTVRCGECSYEWFQARYEDDEDEEAFDHNDETDEVLQKIMEEDDLPEIDLVSSDEEELPPIRSQEPENREGNKIKEKKQKQGRLAAALLFIAVAVSLFLYKPTITEAWPDTHAAYSLFGSNPNLLNRDDISFERFEAVRVEGNLEVSGIIYNLRRDDLTLPPLRVALRDKDRNLLQEAVIILENPIIPYEETLSLNEKIKVTTEKDVALIEIRPVTFLDQEQEKPQFNVSSEG